MSETPYIQNLEKKQADVKKKLDAVNKQVTALKKESERLFLEWHDYRGQIDAERELGYPHGKPKKR
jgi:ABC-type phosphate transport system auxiliary subunit